MPLLLVGSRVSCFVNYFVYFYSFLWEATSIVIVAEGREKINQHVVELRTNAKQNPYPTVHRIMRRARLRVRLAALLAEISMLAESRV